MADVTNSDADNKTNRSPYSNLGTDEAMNLVLKAEHDAQQAVAACEQEAHLTLQQAREKAHRITERSDARISRVHQRCSRIVTDEINRIQQDAAQQRNSEQASAIDDNTIVAAVDKLVALLTGAMGAGNVTELRRGQGRSSSEDKPK